MEVRLSIVSTLLLTPLVCRQLVKGKCFISRPINRTFFDSRVLSSQSQWGSKKKHRNVKINFDWHKMADPNIEVILAPFREKVKEQVNFQD